MIQKNERDETISICNVGRRERKNIFSRKGKKTPLSFQFVMMLKPDLSPEFLAKYNLAVREDEIAGLFINILYDRQGLKCTSGVSRKTFVLDKTLEEAWDQEVKERFLTKSTCKIFNKLRELKETLFACFFVDIC